MDPEPNADLTAAVWPAAEVSTQSSLESMAWQFLLLRVAGANLTECWKVAQTQGLRPSQVMEAFQHARLQGMSFSRKEGQELSHLAQAEGINAPDELHFLHQLFQNPSETIFFALQMARKNPCPWMPGCLLRLGLDPLSVALHGVTYLEARELMASMSHKLPRGLVIPGGEWVNPKKPLVFENCRFPPSRLLIVAKRALHFIRCSFHDVAPPLQASQIRIEGGEGLRMIPVLHTFSLSLLEHPLLERLPRGLSLRDDFEARACPRLRLPEGLAVGGRLILEALGSHGGLPPGLSAGKQLGILDCSGFDLTHLPSQLASLVLAGLPQLQSLSPDLRISLDLTLSDCPITHLPRDLHVPGTLRLYNLDQIRALPEGLLLGGNLEIDHCPLLHLPEQLHVPGNLTLIGLAGLDTLPKDLVVGGFLTVTNCPRLERHPEFRNWMEATPLE